MAHGRRAPRWALGVVLAAAAGGSARAQAPADRPSEQEMFGGPPASPSPSPASPDGGVPAAPVAPKPEPGAQSAPTAPPAAVEGGSARDQALLGNDTGDVQHLSDYQAPENPLQIGGQLYLRAQSTTLQDQNVGAWSLAAPSLLDVYMDVRPNPRVRAFILGRMSYDPTAAAVGAPLPPGATSGSGALVGGSATGFTTFNALRGPNSILDQMWMRFDIASRVFVTAGKQHVRWGTGRFWQPTDYLHPIKRNPLDVFDARPGASMVKLHVPWEDQGWNFYAFVVTDGAFELDSNAAANTLHQVAGAGRIEAVVAGVEIGIDTFLKRGQKPRVGLDFSTGVYDFDVYGDCALRSGQDFTVVTDSQPGQPLGSDLAQRFSVGLGDGLFAQVVGGINYSRKYNDNDMFTIGAEYFYNQAGYTDPTSYAGFIYNQQAVQVPLSIFYLGRQYGALYASFPAPYSWNYTTFTVSTLGNLSDHSFVSRLDYSLTFLTHLTLQAFAGVHYGASNGELRFGINIPSQDIPQAPPSQDIITAPIVRSPVLLDLGVALLVKL
jgi:hypothetical protein